MDRWPTFDLSPADYERAVQHIVNEAGHEVTEFEARHLDAVEASDGVYIIDVTVRFRFLGADFLMLFECKRHASPVERGDVQILHTKLQSIGAQKGVVVAASGFQRGALTYARRHGIACVRLLDDGWTYEARDQLPAEDEPSGIYSAYARSLMATGSFGDVRLTDHPDRIQHILFGR